MLDKPPSAELRPDQRDDQSLPPYEELDPVLQGYVEGDRTAADLVADGFDPAVVDQVVRLVDGAEYKRRQMPPGVRITTKAFGKDRRMPITNRYRPPVPGRGLPWVTTSLAARTPAPLFRTIGELAERCGHYCWVESRLFELTGSWASRPAGAAGDPELRVFFSEMSAWHAFAGRPVGRPPAGAGRASTPTRSSSPRRVGPSRRSTSCEAEPDSGRGWAGWSSSSCPSLLGDLRRAPAPTPPR